MWGRVLAIALNTYRESVRARVLLGLAGVAGAVSLYSLVVGAYTLRNAPRVVSDLGAASLSLFSVVVAVVIGATTLHRELEMKTIFPILARPIGRGEYLVGKYLGILLTVAVFVAADAGLVLTLSALLGGRSPALAVGLPLGTVLVLALVGLRDARALTFGTIPWSLVLLVLGAWLAEPAPIERRVVLSGALLTLFEVGIIAAIAMLFSAFSTPFVSSLLTLGLFVIGRNADALARLPTKYFGKGMHDAGVALSKAVPNLQIYVPARPILSGEALDVVFSSYAARAGLVAVAWAALLLSVGTLVFKRRDFL